MAVEDAHLAHPARPDLLLHAPCLLGARHEAGIVVFDEVAAVRLELPSRLWLVTHVLLEQDEVGDGRGAALGEEVAEALARKPAPDRADEPIVHGLGQEDFKICGLCAHASAVAKRVPTTSWPARVIATYVDRDVTAGRFVAELAVSLPERRAIRRHARVAGRVLSIQQLLLRSGGARGWHT